MNLFMKEISGLMHSIHLRDDRIGNRLYAADSRRARRKFRSRNKELVALGFCRTTGHATTRKSIPIGVRSRVAVGECLQEGYDLILFLVGQSQITGCHVNVVRNLWHRPAVYFLGRSCWAMPGSDVVLIFIARVVEVDELLQALDVAVMKELLLKVRARGLGRRTLRWRHSNITCRSYLHLAVGTWGKLGPGRVRVGGGTETTPQESS